MGRWGWISLRKMKLGRRRDDGVEEEEEEERKSGGAPLFQ